MDYNKEQNKVVYTAEQIQTIKSLELYLAQIVHNERDDVKELLSTMIQYFHDGDPVMALLEAEDSNDYDKDTRFVKELRRVFKVLPITKY